MIAQLQEMRLLLLWNHGLIMSVWYQLYWILCFEKTKVKVQSYLNNFAGNNKRYFHHGSDTTEPTVVQDSLFFFPLPLLMKNEGNPNGTMEEIQGLQASRLRNQVRPAWSVEKWINKIWRGAKLVNVQSCYLLCLLVHPSDKYHKNGQTDCWKDCT